MSNKCSNSENAVDHGAGPEAVDYRERGFAFNKIGRYQNAVEDLTVAIEKSSGTLESFDYRERAKAFEGLGFHDRAMSDTQFVKKYQSLSLVKDLN